LIPKTLKNAIFFSTGDIFFAKNCFVSINKYPAVELTSNRLVFQGEQIAF